MALGHIEGKIPQEWITPFLNEIVTPKQWKTISTKELKNSGYTVYGANGKIGFYNEYTHVYPTIMITCRGATCGNIHISEPCSYINGNAMALDNFPKDYMQLKFLKYALLARGLEDTISGSAQPQITRQGLEKVKIPLASFTEQKIIADKLDDLLARVESIKTRLENIPEILKKFRQSVLSAAVSGKLTDDWRKNNSYEEWKKLQLIDVIESKPRNGYSPKGVDYKTPVKNLTLSAITQGYFSKDCFKYVDIEVPETSHLWIKKDDILIQRANSIDYVGISAIYRGDDDKYIYPDLIMKVRANDRIITEYLHYCLLSEDTREYFRQNASGTTGNMPKINQGTVSAVSIKLPPLPEQIEIVRRAEKIFNFSESIERLTGHALSQINNLTQSILAKAFRGELTAQWREENPELISGLNSAEALLEKITAEKLAAGTVKKRAKKTSH